MGHETIVISESTNAGVKANFKYRRRGKAVGECQSVSRDTVLRSRGCASDRAVSTTVSKMLKPRKVRYLPSKTFTDRMIHVRKTTSKLT